MDLAVTHNIVHWIVKESGADCCQLCKKYNQDEQLSSDDDEPCPHCRAEGEKACIEGIIEHFSEVNA